ncbi:MAG TPA: hypothetical protein VNG29_01980 [Candidatus Paceibacterota bacterium]|nr:hypothetical protein [Candidatus Paceibacterota bacterium]
MKPKIVVIGIVVVLAVAGIFYFVVLKNSNQVTAPQTAQSSEPTPTSVIAATSSPATATFDANDGLGQAIQDLNTVVQ